VRKIAAKGAAWVLSLRGRIYTREKKTRARREIEEQFPLSSRALSSLALCAVVHICALNFSCACHAS